MLGLERRGGEEGGTIASKAVSASSPLPAVPAALAGGSWPGSVSQSPSWSQPSRSCRRLFQSCSRRCTSCSADDESCGIAG